MLCFASSVRGVWLSFVRLSPQSLTVLCAVLFAAPALGAVGRTVGSFNVSATGAATYTIPIWTPPGVNGMQPNLALNYNSQSGNGLLGVGWSLAGFSTITRCHRTYAQDGGGGSPQLDANDRFCLDGQRLRSTAGSYGANGSTYQTEIANFALVTSYGTAGTGPAWFEVKGKNGWIYEYGHTTDSAIVSTGVASVRVWALSSVRDRSGNEMRFTYTNDTTNGSYRPASIHFTYTHASSSPSYQVTFSYQSRPSADVLWSYTIGGKNNELNYLNQIDVNYHNGSAWTLQRRYTLGYTSGAASSRLRINSIQECSATDCLPALTIGHQDGASGWGSEIASSGNMANMADSMPIDVNGDGIQDLVYPDPSGNWYYSLGTSSGAFQGPYSMGIANTNFSAAIPIDYNSDGRQDILVPNTSGYWRVLFFQSAGGVFSYIDTGTPSTGASGGWATAADLDGDGREDLVYLYEAANTWGAARHIYYRTNTGSGFSTTQGTLYTVQSGGTTGPFSKWGSLAPLGTNASRFVAKNRRLDFNNDGRTDLLVYLANCSADLPGQCTSGAISYTWRIILSTAGGTYQGMDAVGFGYGSSSLYPPLAADYNGDGCTDLAYPTSGTWRMRFGTCWRAGVTFSLDTFVNTGSTYYGSFGYAMDWDGDGRDDIVSANGSGTLGYARSTGATLNAWTSLGITPGASTTFVADANGDGQSDLVYSASNALRTRLHNGAIPDLVTSFTDGYGLTTSPTYVYLTHNNYTKYSDAQYPEQDYQGPLSVVASATGPNGIGGTFTQSFWYYGARIDVQGRGFEGFDATRLIDNRDGLHRYQYFKRTFPYTGLLYQADLYQSNGSTLIARTTNSWVAPELDSATYNKRYFPYVSQSTRHDYEVGGPYNAYHLRTTTVSNSYDSYGTLYDQTATTTEVNTGLYPSATHTQRTLLSGVTNDTANWCLSKPSQVEQIHSHGLPGGSSITRTRSFSWNSSACRLTQEVVEPGNALWQVATSFGYDGFGNINSVTATPASGQGQSARTTTAYWGTTGYFPITVTNPKSQTTTSGWDVSKGFRTSVTDPNNLQTEWEYDSFGRVTRFERPDETAIDFTLNWCNTGGCQGSDTNLRTYVLEVERDTGNSEITRAYHYADMFDRETWTQRRTVTGAYSTVRTYFNARGLVDQQTMPYLPSASVYSTAYTYDAIGRPTLIRRPTSDTDSSNHDTQVSYQGLTIITTDALNHATTHKHNAIGQIIQSIDAASSDIDYEYDAFGNLLKTRNSSNHETVLTYNVRGMKMSSSDPDMGYWTYNYFPLGELKSQTDAKGQQTTFTYDELSRPLTRVMPEGAGSITSTYTWGSSSGAKNIGQLEWMEVAGTGVTTYRETYTYDTFGRPLQVKYTESGSDHFIDYSYYSATGLLQEIVYPTSTWEFRFPIRYEYQYGLPSRVWNSSNDNQYWLANASDARGNITDDVYGGGTNGETLQTLSSYDHVTGRLKSRQSSYTSGAISGTVLDNLGFLYDKMGNLIQRQDNRQGLTENFYYDALDRLDYSTRGANTTDYSYDAKGNLTSKTGVGTNYSYTATVAGCTYYTHPQIHAVRQITGGASTMNFCYDANGNMTNRNGTSISWFANNLPKAITKDANNSSTFEYAPDGRRWKQVYRTGGSNYTTTYFGNLAERVVGPTYTDWKHYVYVNGEAIALYLRSTSGNKKHFFFNKDHLGSMSAMSRSDGLWNVRESFTAHGERRGANWSGTPSTGELNSMNDTTRRGFTLHEHLDSTGLIHMNGRVYEPNIGRFVSADPFVTNPLNTQGFNRYSYVLNNPLRYTDPSGFDPNDFIDVRYGSWREVIFDVGRGGSPADRLGNDTSGLDMSVRTVVSITGFGANANLNAGRANLPPMPVLGRPPSVLSPIETRTPPEEERVQVAPPYGAAGGIGSGGGAESTEGRTPFTSFAEPGSFSANAGYRFYSDPDISPATKEAVAASGLVLMTGGTIAFSSPTVAALFGLGVEPTLISDGGTGRLGRLGPGPHAGESIAARSSARDFTAAERAEINRIGSQTGCHTCGVTTPGTKSGNFVPDHQPPNALNSAGGPQRLYPQCIGCSREQGLEIARQLKVGNP